MFGLLGRSKLGILCFRVVLVLDSSDFVDVSLRNKPLASSVGVTPTATTVAGPAATSTATTAACDGGELASLGNTRVRFLASLRGHIQLHYAFKVRKLRTVDQDGIPGSVQAWVLDPFFKVVDLHALLEWGNVVLHEKCMSVVLRHMGKAILVKGPIIVVTLIDLGLEG